MDGSPLEGGGNVVNDVTVAQLDGTTLPGEGTLLLGPTFPGRGRLFEVSMALEYGLVQTSCGLIRFAARQNIMFGCMPISRFACSLRSLSR